MLSSLDTLLYLIILIHSFIAVIMKDNDQEVWRSGLVDPQETNFGSSRHTAKSDTSETNTGLSSLTHPALISLFSTNIQLE